MRFHFFQDGIIDVIDPETAYAKTVDRKIVLFFFTFVARAGGFAIKNINPIVGITFRGLDGVPFFLYFWEAHQLRFDKGRRKA